MSNITTTYENSVAFVSTDNHLLEFFSKAASVMNSVKSFYEDQGVDPIRLFENAWKADRITAMKILFWLRDIRGGAGNRSTYKDILRWLAINHPKWVEANLPYFPEIGRWDDLRCLFGTPVENQAALFWSKAIEGDNVLAAKWADRKDKPLLKFLGFKKEGDFRKYLSRKRKGQIVEEKMCRKEWEDIEFSKVPSLAMARYAQCFTKNSENFSKYKEALKTGKTKVNAQAVFPHDCVKTALFDEVIANEQFKSLPNYMGDTEEIIMPLVDTSGSMVSRVFGNTKAVHVAKALALYCSGKVPESSVFYKKFIEFKNETQFTSWDKLSFSEAVLDLFNEAVGSTRIDKALDLILNTSLFFKLEKEKVPSMLLILSDMQFSSSFDNPEGIIGRETEIEKSLKKWDDAGYKRPKIVYWSIVAYANTPATVDTENCCLVSGFSPSLMKGILMREKITPMGILYETIKEYEINIP